MKRLIALLLAVCMIACLTACGGGKPSRPSAQSVVEAALKAAQSGDIDSIAQYWGNSFEDMEPTGSEDAEKNASAADAAKLILSGMTYKILSSEENEEGGTAVVKAEITNTDMEKIMQQILPELFMQALAAAFSEDPDAAQEEIDAQFMERLNDMLAASDKKSVTNTVDIALKLVDNTWVIDPADEVIDAMYGGIRSFTEALENAFSSDGQDAATANVYENEGDLGNFHVKFIECTVSKDYDGNDALIVHYEFTNNSEDTTSAGGSIYTQAFQDGVQMDPAFMSGDYGGDNEWKDIRPGTTLDIYNAFKLTSKSPVEIDFSEYMSFTNDKVTASYNLG